MRITRFTSRLRGPSIAMSLAFILGACRDTPDPIGPQGQPAGGSSLSVAIGQEPVKGSISDHFQYLAQVAPGFTGVFFDESGILTVSVASDNFSTESLDRILTWARAHASTSFTTASVKIRRVPFDFSTLSSWYAVVSKAVQPEDDLNATDIDETRGVIKLGFSSMGRVDHLRSRLKALGVPSQMVEFEQREPAQPETTLNQKYRPAVGGLQIQMPGNPGPSTCTLGFNVLKWGTGGTYDLSLGRFFLTASHCSMTRGLVSGLPLYQHTATAGNRIGVEVDHADTLSGAACPAAKSPCQHADVLVVQYDDSVSTLYLRVANVDASKNITGTYNLQGAPTVGGITGEVVTKVGENTGKTTGTITATCVDHLLTGIWQLCQGEANYGSAGGDSGAPIFLPYSPTNWNTPRLVGLHSSAQGSVRYYTPMNQIDYALNYVYFWL